MDLVIKQISPDQLAIYAGIPIAFTVRSVLEVDPIEAGLGGLRLREVAVQSPYVKDYDGYADGGPERWLKRFDTTNWAFFLALDKGWPVGGATVAVDTPNLIMLAGRTDLAVLWDLRVLPERRQRGIGTKLFEHAAGWSKERGRTQLKIETQNINVPACRFYARQGCRLGEMDRYAYAANPDIAHEVMLIWYLDL
jgi:GNAT superfamily N-acetyltransferase